jgi:hypothetical protein
VKPFTNGTTKGQGKGKPAAAPDIVTAHVAD